MTAITFPTDPANGELYTAPNGCVYIWDGEKWIVNSTIYTGPALADISQDRVAPMFVNGVNTGITFTYNETTNTLTSTVTGGDRVANGLLNIALDTTGDFVPSTDNLQDLGSPTNRFRHLYVGPGSVYIGNNVITESATGGLVLPGVTRATGYYADEVDEDDDWGSNPTITGAVTVIDASRYRILAGRPASANYSPATYTAQKDGNRIDEITVSSGGSGWDKVEADYARDNNMYATNVVGAIATFNAGNWVQIPYRVEVKAEDTEYEDIIGGGTTLPSQSGQDGKFLTTNGSALSWDTPAGGEGLGTITIPAATGTDYKGLQVSYGSFYGNPQSTTRSVNKVVIHKPAVTTTTITDDSNDDFFQVSGVGTSDVLAMFVFFGDINGEKPVSDIQAFAEEVIDLVILDEGVEGDYNTVDEMKTAFYANYADLATALNGLATDFRFFDNVLALNGGVTTVREGSGAVFEIADSGLGYYNIAGMLNTGTNYRVGHKVLVLGTDLGGATPDNDCIVRVDSIEVDGAIFQWSVTGVAAGAEPNVYSPVTGTNYNVGSGFTVTNIEKYTGYVNYNTYGTNYVVGDVITLLGANLTSGTTPENNITITVVQVDGGGQPFDYTSSGTIPDVWRANSIDDGQFDEYDTGNYIDSSYDTQIDYNGGATVANGVAAFGTGSSYSFVYQASIFGLFVTGNSSTRIGTSGGGGDSGSVAVAGNIYGPDTAEQIFDNAVTHINIVSDPYAGPLITFTRTDYGDEIDEISDGLHITKDDQGWLYNDLEDDGHGSNTPTGSRWNNDGWDDFSNVESRTYTSLSNIWNGNFQNIPGAKMIMLDETTDKYWAIEFLSWTNGGNGGGASYTRQELDLTSVATGIRFPDGTRLTSAAGVGRVKLTSPGNRRIEEVHGYKSVSVTEVVTTNLTTVASIDQPGGNYIWIDPAATTIDSIINTPANYGNAYGFEFSLDNTTWYAWTNGTGTSGGSLGYSVAQPLTYLQGATVYFRYKTGGDSVVWWSSADLPGGSSNFRGAIIDYHAYISAEGTVIGTIHIVDDDGDEHITHTELTSGTSDLENADLWYVTQEGQIRYRRIDGESSNMRVQWTARVFYGSEYYND